MSNPDLEQFRRWLIDEQRFSPGTVDQSVRKMTYIFSHSENPVAPLAIQVQTDLFAFFPQEAGA